MDETIQKVLTSLEAEADEQTLLVIRRSYEQARSEIDCLACGVCCGVFSVVLEDEDIERFRAYCGLAKQDFIDQYLIWDEEYRELVFKDKPCRFQKDNACACYDQRGKACRAYPYFDELELPLNFEKIAPSYELCPLVRRTLDLIKESSR